MFAIYDSIINMSECLNSGKTRCILPKAEIIRAVRFCGVFINRHRLCYMTFFSLLNTQLLLSLLLFCCLLSVVYYNLHYFRHFSWANRREKEIVLFAATPLFGSPLERWNYLKKCPEEQKYCRISSKQEDSEKAAAVLFHNRDFKMTNLPRRKEQVYVWYSREPPGNENISVPEDFINWTMTYKRDSEVWYPYSTMEYVMKENEVDWDAIWNNKTKSTALLVSNCKAKNRRLDIVKALKAKGLELDIWGGCGTPLPECPRRKGIHCSTEHMIKYKFYLALEGANCPDYVTEKFWFSLDRYFTVPIVMKRSYYDAYEIPPSAFIALDDFSSMEELIGYIQRITKSRSLYMHHHKWRSHYRVVSDSPTDFCALCRRLKDNNTPQKSYKNLSSWFSGSCEQSLYKSYLS